MGYFLVCGAVVKSKVEVTLRSVLQEKMTQTWVCGIFWFVEVLSQSACHRVILPHCKAMSRMMPMWSLACIIFTSREACVKGSSQTEPVLFSFELVLSMAVILLSMIGWFLAQGIFRLVMWHDMGHSRSGQAMESTAEDGSAQIKSSDSTTTLLERKISELLSENEALQNRIKRIKELYARPIPHQVWVTKSGRVYHTSLDCPAVKHSDSSGLQGFMSCSFCVNRAYDALHQV